MEKFADDLDRASAIEQSKTEESINASRRAAAPEQVQDATGRWQTYECVDCGDDLIGARLQMGKVRCVHCQTKLEYKRKGLF